MARGPGLRVQMSAITGVTMGKSADMLRPAFRFQCPPLDSLQRDYGHNHVRVNNYQGKEYVMRGGKRLRTVPIRTLIVEWGRYVVEQRWDLDTMQDTLTTVSEEGYPFRLLCTHQYGDEAEVDMPCVLESVSITEPAGEPDARYIDLQFTQYDDPQVNRKTNKRTGGKHFPFTITLRKDGSYTADSKATFRTKGEPLTFAVIASYAYGMPSMANVVARAQKPPITDWGMSTPLISHGRFRKKGGKILVPFPPEVNRDPRPIGRPSS